MFDKFKAMIEGPDFCGHADSGEAHEGKKRSLEYLGAFSLEYENRFIYIGSGHARVTWWDKETNQVIKTGKGCEEDNMREGMVWRLLHASPKRDYLCPVVRCRDDKFMVMEPAHPLDMGDLVVCIPGIFDYYRRNNFGWYQESEIIERLVSVDFPDVTLEANREDWSPVIGPGDKAGEPFTYDDWLTPYMVGDRRLIETKERCDSEGELVPPIDKKIIARYVAYNEPYITNLWKLAKNFKVGKPAIDKFRKIRDEHEERKRKDKLEFEAERRKHEKSKKSTTVKGKTNEN